MTTQLLRMQTRVLKVNQANGWFDSERTFGEDIALLHSEISEMLEAYRRWGIEDSTHWDAENRNQGPCVNCTYCKPEGIGSEAADVLVRWLDSTYRYEIPLPDWLKLDTKGEWGTSKKFGDYVAELHFFASHIWDTYEGNGHVITDLVTRRFQMFLVLLLDVCRYFKIDLLWEFDRKMYYNATRGYRHGNRKL